MATVLSRWMATVVLAAGLGSVAMMTPAPARAGDGDDWVRVVVDVADVIYHSGYPYYRYDNGYRDRLIVVQDYGRPRYYRRVYRPVYRPGPPHGNAYGYYNNGKCNKHGKCTTHYYDGRYDDRRDRVYYYSDRDRYDHRYDGNRYVRYEDDRYRDDRRRHHDDD